MRTPIVLASLLLFALPLAACGDDTGGGTGGGGTGGGGTGGSDASTTTATTATSASTGGSAGAAEIVDCAGADIALELTTDGLAFVQSSPIALDVGDILRFTPDDATHNMTADDGSFATDTGATQCVRFNDAGSYPFHCSVHVSMTGIVNVE